MIRRDYVLRQVQELAQVVLRVLFLRQRQDYQAALAEIGRALRSVENTGGLGATDRPTTRPSLSVEDWVALCRRQEAVTGPLMLAVADLLQEQGETLAAMNRADDAGESRGIALALYLESILDGSVPVTQGLLDKVDGLTIATSGTRLDSAVLSRLAAYLEQRGRLDSAEDALFEWLEQDAPAAFPAATAFYQRLVGRPDAELIEGGLPRAEIEDGLNELARRRSLQG